MNIYVGNLAYSVTEDDLNDAFSTYGNVTSVKLITDKFSGQSKGFGFVEMAENGAQEAIEAMDGANFGGRNLKVNEARPRPTGGGQRGGSVAGGA